MKRLLGLGLVMLVAGLSGFGVRPAPPVERDPSFDVVDSSVDSRRLDAIVGERLPVAAGRAGQIRGVVLAPSGQGVADFDVTLIPLNAEVLAGPDGHLPPTLGLRDRIAVRSALLLDPVTSRTDTTGSFIATRLRSTVYRVAAPRSLRVTVDGRSSRFASPGSFITIQLFAAETPASSIAEADGDGRHDARAESRDQEARSASVAFVGLEAARPSDPWVVHWIGAKTSDSSGNAHRLETAVRETFVDSPEVRRLPPGRYWFAVGRSSEPLLWTRTLDLGAGLRTIELDLPAEAPPSVTVSMKPIVAPRAGSARLIVERVGERLPGLRFSLRSLSEPHVRIEPNPPQDASGASFRVEPGRYRLSAVSGNSSEPWYEAELELIEGEQRHTVELPRSATLTIEFPTQVPSRVVLAQGFPERSWAVVDGSHSTTFGPLPLGWYRVSTDSGHMGEMVVHVDRNLRVRFVPNSTDSLAVRSLRSGHESPLRVGDRLVALWDEPLDLPSLRKLHSLCQNTSVTTPVIPAQLLRDGVAIRVELSPRLFSHESSVAWECATTTE